jgi:class 3 adenylate cyclase/tetratricopeptide (TPR) repeat protein
MTACPSCGHENSPGAKFCSECGLGLLEATRPREERKVVTVLFADLVGFTTRAEQLDPEDVRSVLAPYYARLRRELERFGGTVEKFIGDAVMALFGAPVAHEDDPERAVRAALAIRDWAREESNINVRIGVNTGEALISLGARPTEGEGMAAGDVVNTAARMQAAAPINGIFVGETTYRATARQIDYLDVDPIEAKGKTEPVRVWQAVEPRSRVGTEVVSMRAPLVGRRREVDQLVDAFERARQERTTSLVTVVGVPGIGKSRLVAELFEHVESLPDFVYWRHGRSLPYGEGVTFWALGEMVKAQAGILESDSPEEVERKLRETVVQSVGESERRWVETKLRPLLGIGGDEDAGGERSESFSAWRTFFESLAEQQPLVMVFEDIHWAGDELLDFVDELPDWIEDVPLLVLCTARPELLDRRSGWGGGKRNAATISVSPLDADDTARLIAALLDRSVLPAETQSALLARAGGNPLYAEQFVRMLSERGEIQGELPENVQGIIAARLDSLADDEKRLLQDAAVVGKVFWTTALAAVNGSQHAVLEQSLRSLVRKDFVRRERRASVEGESEYAFNHVLVRDVAYGQIPRSVRGDKHLRAAEWIESLGRAEDQAELLAHHYQSALELAQASGAATAELEPRVRTALRAAGTRALALNAYAAAARSFEAAAELAGDPDPDRPRALLRHGLALQALLDGRRFDLLEEARSALVAAGDTDGAAEADLALAEAWWWAGERDRCSACLDRAAELIREGGATATRASVLSQVARFLSLFGENDAAVVRAEESLRLAETFQRDDLRAKNLITLGTARGHQPGVDPEAALADLRAGIELAAAYGDFNQLSRGYVNLSSHLQDAGELQEAESLMLQARDLAQLRGHAPGIRFVDGNLIDLDLTRGRWDAAERRARAFLAVSGAEGHYMDNIALSALSTFELARDELEDALHDADLAITAGRKVRDPQALVPALAIGAFVYAELADTGRATALLKELEPAGYVNSVPLAFFAAARVGQAEELRAASSAFRRGTPWDRAGLAVLDGRWPDAAREYAEMGAAPFAALADLRAAESYADAGRRVEANEHLSRSLQFWRSIGASRFVREAEALLAKSA